jgi:hypothetical protein
MKLQPSLYCAQYNNNTEKISEDVENINTNVHTPNTIISEELTLKNKNHPTDYSPPNSPINKHIYRIKREHIYNVNNECINKIMKISPQTAH